MSEALEKEAIEMAKRKYMGNWYNDGPLQLIAQNDFEVGWCAALRESPLLLSFYHAGKAVVLATKDETRVKACKILEEALENYERLIKENK